MYDAAFAEQPYVDARTLVIAALDLLEPPERLTVPQYAAAHRILDNAGGGHVGPWLNEIAPYTVQPSEMLDSLDHLTVAVVGPGQVGKTVIPENWLLRSIDTDPADFLWYMHTDDGIESYVKGRINPMIDLHERIRSKLGRKAVDDSLHYKRFQGMSTEFLAAGLSTLVNKSAPRIVVDEWDNLQLLNPKPMFDVRRQTFGAQSMLIALSHPDMAKGLDPDRDWQSGIMALFGDSDRRLWHWPCPQCNTWSSPCPTARRQMTINYIKHPEAPLDEVADSAHLLCPHGCVIEDKWRRDMNSWAFKSDFGGWVGEGQTITEAGKVTGDHLPRDIAGFWIVGAMSPFVLGGIHGLVRERVKAERSFEISGDDDDLRLVVVKQWGEPYRRLSTSDGVDADTLAERAEPDLALGEVPEGCRFITLFVDVQKWGFDYLYRGFGPHGESWVLHTGRLSQRPGADIPITPATSPDDWDLLIDLFNRQFPLADGSGRVMKVRGMGIDSRGEPGVTQQAYTAWKRWKKRQIVKFFGQDSGRDIFNIILTGGAAGIRAPKLQVVYPDTARKAGAAARGQVPVASFNPNKYKDDLAGQLKISEPGPWYIHFPYALRSAKRPHLFFEQVTAEHEVKPGIWEKKTPAIRNEGLDQLVGTHVVAHLHGLTRMDWEKPRIWAAPWESNSYVLSASDAEQAAAAPDQVTATPGDPDAPPKKKTSLASRLA
jgi:phage terminase large subunit GpA-like protein